MLSVFAERALSHYIVGNTMIPVMLLFSCSIVSDSVTSWTPVHGVLQARILEWVAFPSSRGSLQPRDLTQVSGTAGGFFTSWAARDAPERLGW